MFLWYSWGKKVEQGICTYPAIFASKAKFIYTGNIHFHALQDKQVTFQKVPRIKIFVTFIFLFLITSSILSQIPNPINKTLFYTKKKLGKGLTSPKIKTHNSWLFGLVLIGSRVWQTSYFFLFTQVSFSQIH